MKTTHRCLAIATVALMVQAFGTTAANAADKAPSRTVKYQDLDVTNPADAKRLYTRIRTAAKSVCAQLNGRQLVEQVKASSCEADAMERAIKQVDEPVLTQYYLTRNPNSALNPSVAAKRD